MKIKLKQTEACRLHETLHRQRLQPTPKLPPPEKHRVRHPTGRNLNLKTPNQNRIWLTVALCACLAWWRFVDRRTPPPLGRSTWSLKLTPTKRKHESRLSAQDVRKKPRLTTSPALPLGTPANEPATALEGMEGSRCFETPNFHLVTTMGRCYVIGLR